MKLFKAFAYAVVAAAAFGLAACGDDDPKEPGTDPVPDGPDEPAVEGVLSPEESKEYIEETALQFMNLFNANDQKPLADLADYINTNYTDLEAPEEWADIIGDDENYGPYYSPDAIAKAIKEAVNTGNYTAIARAAENVYRFSDFTGVFEPSNGQWVKTGKSSDIVFIFQGPKGKCELKAAANGEWDYNYTDEYYPEDNFTVKVPKQLNVTLTEGSETLVNATIDNNVNISGQTIYVKADVKAANIHAIAEINGTGSKITETQALAIGGKTYQTSEATINGSKMLDPETLNAIAEEEIAIDKVFKNAEAKATLMNRVFVNATAKNFGALAEIDTYFDNWVWDDNSNNYIEQTKDDAERLCKQSCKVINDNVKGEIRYAGNSAVQATVEAYPYYYDDPYYWDWEVSARVKYADGSSQSFDELLDNTDFTKVENKWNSLVRAYKNLFDF